MAQDSSVRVCQQALSYLNRLRQSQKPFKEQPQLLKHHFLLGGVIVVLGESRDWGEVLVMAAAVKDIRVVMRELLAQVNFKRAVRLLGVMGSNLVGGGAAVGVGASYQLIIPLGELCMEDNAKRSPSTSKFCLANPILLN